MYQASAAGSGQASMASDNRAFRRDQERLENTALCSMGGNRGGQLVDAVRIELATWVERVWPQFSQWPPRGVDKLAAERDGKPLGYAGAARIPDPAVVTLNGIVASAAATEVLQQLTGFAGTSSPNCGWTYHGTTGTVERLSKTYRGCDACRYERGLGDP